MLNPTENTPPSAPETAKKKSRAPQLTNTLFRNALKSNLDLTALADTKASILISINGFILTVSVTAASLITHDDIMTYAFIAIIITALSSIILAILSVKPRVKEKLVSKHHLEGYESLLYYQDIAALSPKAYLEKMNAILDSRKKSKNEMINHLHILGVEIRKKYRWLAYAYANFSVGLLISGALIVYALVDANARATAQQENEGIVADTFYNIFEPSGAITMDTDHILLVEDEQEARPLKLLKLDESNRIEEIGDLHIPKKLRKQFKKKIEDLEAITADGTTVYAVTSHSPTHTNKPKKERKRLLRMTYDDESLTDLQVYKSLKHELESWQPELFSPTLLNHSPINIEGITVNSRNHALLLGFRAPLSNAKAIIVAIDNPDELFAKHPPKPLFEAPMFLDLDGLGIRAMQYDSRRNGLWIVGGSSGDRLSKFRLFFYDIAAHKTIPMGKNIDIGYSEGITILETGTKRYLFLVQDNGEKPNKAASYMLIDMDTL